MQAINSSKMIDICLEACLSKLNAYNLMHSAHCIDRNVLYAPLPIDISNECTFFFCNFEGNLKCDRSIENRCWFQQNEWFSNVSLCDFCERRKWQINFFCSKLIFFLEKLHSHTLSYSAKKNNSNLQSNSFHRPTYRQFSNWPLTPSFHAPWNSDTNYHLAKCSCIFSRTLVGPV